MLEEEGKNDLVVDGHRPVPLGWYHAVHQEAALCGDKLRETIMMMVKETITTMGRDYSIHFVTLQERFNGK